MTPDRKPVLPAGYHLRQGSSLDRSLLVQFMQRTYEEIEPAGNYGHLALTIDQYLSHETPLWWVDLDAASGERSLVGLHRATQPIACLWLGNAIDQICGDRHAHIFLLYVAAEHRRRGIGSALMVHAQEWAATRGDRQIGLQVFLSNQAALTLYRKLGFQTQSLWMVKSLQSAAGN